MPFSLTFFAWLLLGSADAFSVAPRKAEFINTRLHSTRQQLSEQMTSMQSQLDENEDARLLLQALRGQNLNDDDRAVEGLDMKLVDIVVESDETSGLPLSYDPTVLKQFFAKRPLTIVTRLLQLSSVGGGFLFELGLDQIFQRTKNNPDLEVKRAGQLRDLLTSLGPFYIKVGQALSIRPDILSPRSMVELQQLCDKVPSFDSRIAFATIERELGAKVSEVFAEITPEPVAAASLGQGTCTVPITKYGILGANCTITSFPQCTRPRCTAESLWPSRSSDRRFWKLSVWTCIWYGKLDCC